MFDEAAAYAHINHPNNPYWDDGEPWRCADPVELRRWAVDRDRRIALHGDVWADEG